MSVTNRATGVITGNASGTTDGDGIDIDYLVSITNSGTIRALGTVTGASVNEAIAVGGGTITNNANATISSTQRAITVDDSNGGNAFGATTITNSGTITAGTGFDAILIVSNTADSITNNSGGTITGNITAGSGGVTLSNAGTITGNVSTGGGADAITNTGSITGSISTAGGDDTLTLGAVRANAVDLGAGTDSIAINANVRAYLDGTVAGVETIQLGAGSAVELAAAIGSAAVAFGDASVQELVIANSLLSGGAFANTISGLGVGDTITVKGIGTATSAKVGAGNVLSLTGGTSNATLALATGESFANLRFTTASDGAGGTKITVVANTAPVAASLTLNGTEDTPLTGNVSATDANNDALTYSLVAGPASGSLTFNSDGSFSYTPGANVNGSVSFTFKANDGGADSEVKTVTINLAAVNDAPTLTGTKASLAAGSEDTAYTVAAADLLAGYSDADGDTLSVTGLAASNGTVTDNGDGTFTITPTANFNGAVTLSYSVSDGQGGSIAATQSYTLAAVNDAPALTGTKASLAAGSEDTAYTVSAADLLAGYSDADGDTLSVTGLAASNGTVTDNGDGTFTITPTANFNGAVTLSYSVSDGQGGSIAATQSYTLAAVNDAPALTGIKASLAAGSEDTAYTVSAADLLAGYSDADGDTLSVTGLSASNGTVTDNGDGTFTITPTANFNGAVTLSYSVSDGQGGSIAATQSYTLAAVNDAPALTGTKASLAAGSEDTAYTVSAADLLAGYSDVDGDTLSVTGLSASNGTVTDNGDGTFTITPTANFNGAVTLSYSVSDGQGGSIAATQSYTLAAVNDAPALTGTKASLAAGSEDTAYTVSAADLLAGYSDADGDTLVVSGLSASNGTVTDNGDGTFTITPTANFNGAVTLSYSVSDGQGGSIAATQSYTLAAVNDAPALTGEKVQLSDGLEDTGYVVYADDLLAGYSDGDGDALLIENLSASDGTISQNPDGSWTITPSANFTGEVTLSYTIVDGNGGEAAATQTYAVTGVNDAPALTGTRATLAHGSEDTAYTVSAADLLAGYSDIENDTLSVAGLGADHGTVTANGDGTWTVTPDADYNGTVTLSYSVTDGNGGTTAATLSFTLAAVNDAPVLTGAQAVLPNGSEDTVYGVSIDSLLTGYSDVDGDTLSVSGVTADHGTVSIAEDGSYHITPDANYNGPVTLSYTVSDGKGGTTSASLGFSLNAVNDAPQLTGPKATLAAGTANVAYTVYADDLLTGFTDADHDPLSVTGLSASNGTVTDNGDGSFTVLPAPGFGGTMNLSYGVSDGTDTVAATQSYGVTASSNRAPALTGTKAVLADGTEDTAYTVTEAQLLTGYTDADGDTLAVTVVTASSGSVKANGDGTWTITPPANASGPVTLSYTITDGHGGVIGASIGYSLTAVNDAPSALTLSGGSVFENSAAGTLVGTLAATDSDNTSGFIYSLTDDAGGRFIVDSSTGAITVATGAVLDFEAQTSWNITARVADPDGAAIDRTFTIAIGDLPEGRVNWTGTAKGDTFVLGSDNELTANGLAGNDVITGGGAADRIDGGIGNDIVRGGAGNDTLIGGIGNDQLYGEGDNDTLDAGLGNDLVSGGDGDDVILVGLKAGIDTVDGGAGFDTVRATAVKTDIVFASVSGIERYDANGFALVTISGTKFANTMDFSDTILDGISAIRGMAGDDTIIGSAIADKLDGGAGNDTLFGGLGNDVVLGGAGNDRLSGGAGADTLTGGGGNDTFVFADVAETGLGALADTITDFKTKIDKIDVSGIDADILTDGDQAFTYIGNAAFGGTAGQLRLGTVDGKSALLGDTDGDGTADFQITLLATKLVLAASDLVL